MKFLVLSALAALLLAGSSSEAVGAHKQGSVGVSITATRGAMLTHSGAIPSAANVAVYISFNGHSYQAEWLDSQNQIEYGWHGVLVVISGHDVAAPAVIQVASTRYDATQIYVRFVW